MRVFESPLGAHCADGGVHFAVWSRRASALDLCLFDGDAETRIPMDRDGEHWRAFVRGLGAGARYGFRADGPWDPHRGQRFDPHKLLVDPHALTIDRPFAWHGDLALPRPRARDTAALVPKAVVTALPPHTARRKPHPVEGRLIYEVNVRALTMRHPAVPEAERGTLRALAHPAILAHLHKLKVAAVELMPIAAWIDERHLAPLGLENAWGYNPVIFKALDPRVAPGGLADLRFAVRALHDVGIGVLLDVVFNHTGESDAHGATLSLRGLGETDWYRHDPHGHLVNDTGCGNTVACDRPHVVGLIVDALRHFVLHAGIDGFRFDLAPILGRTERGFTRHAPFFEAVQRDPVLADRILIAEPWDVGPGGYHLGGFPPPFLEWNDRARDDIRRFWRGDREAQGALATRLAGSADIFRHGGATRSRTLNFVAAHDGFSLADIVAYRHRHNVANGEHNRDGHSENHSWNNGIEGDTDNARIGAARSRDVRALLSTLFATRGTLLLTAGDEFGRTQHGNNNAYAQANDTTWLDWINRDEGLEAFVAALATFRAAHPALQCTAFLDGTGEPAPDACWFDRDGDPMTEAQWHRPHAEFLGAAFLNRGDRVATVFNRSTHAVPYRLPPPRAGHVWAAGFNASDDLVAAARSVAFHVERKG